MSGEAKPAVHRIVFSRYKGRRGKRDEVLVIRDGDKELMHLHPGVNAVMADVWADLVKTHKGVQGYLADKTLEDRGDAPPTPIVEDAPAKPEATKAADGAGDQGAPAKA